MLKFILIMGSMLLGSNGKVSVILSQFVKSELLNQTDFSNSIQFGWVLKSVQFGSLHYSIRLFSFLI